MPLFTTSGVANTVETMIEANAERHQVNVYNNMPGATVRVDASPTEVATSGNIMKYEDSLVFKHAIARGRLSIISDVATSVVNYTEIVG